MFKLVTMLFLIVVFVQAAVEKDKNDKRECYKCKDASCKKALEKVQCGNYSCMKRIINGIIERVNTITTF